MADETVHEIHAHVLVDLQSKLAKLDGDISIDFPAVDFVQQLHVRVLCTTRLIDLMDVFSEDVHGGADSASVEACRHAESVRGGLSGDVTAGDLSNDGFRDQGQGERNKSIKKRHT